MKNIVRKYLIAAAVALPLLFALASDASAHGGRGYGRHHDGGYAYGNVRVVLPGFALSFAAPGVRAGYRDTVRARHEFRGDRRAWATPRGPRHDMRDVRRADRGHRHDRRDNCRYR